MDFGRKFDEWVILINGYLEDYVRETDTPEKNIYSAMRYSLNGGGKRLRPVLSLAVCELLGGEQEDVIPYACALEMIHTYSLIHDDLPAMDNDDYRRGRLTNHKVYGEALAILSGDALLNKAYELLLSQALKDKKNLSKKIKAASVIAEASGTRGMIGGQIVDIESEGKSIPLEILEYMHKSKTGALIKASVLCAGILCDGTKEELEFLEKYADMLGLAFQIKDDILDIEGNVELMGKEAGSDAKKCKTTYITVYGVKEAKRLLNEITEKTLNYLTCFGEKACFLKSLAEYVAAREK